MTKGRDDSDYCPETIPKWAFWARLEKYHPVAYEVVWLVIQMISLAAIIVSIVQIAQR